MARAPDERYERAKAMYLEGQKLVEIASQLNLPEGTVRRWKSTHKWGSERSDTNSERSDKKKRGAQPGNNNSAGGPPGNKKAERHGFFSKYLPEETVSIIQEMPTDPLDILWDQIQIAYAAIIRAQQIMYVRDRGDESLTKVGQKDGETVTEERWEVQYAWDKHANFMSAQSRQQKTLESLIKQYDEQLHKNWDLATAEQKARINQIRAQTDKLKGTESNEELQKLDKVLEEIKGVV